MSHTNIKNALAHVTTILDTTEYSDNEVLILIPKIVLADEAAAEKYIQDFHKICQFSLANEPGTKRFCAFQPWGQQISTEVWALEHFSSQSSLTYHRASSPVKEMLSWLQDDRPNGTHPLPLPLPLQVMDGSFTHAGIKDVSDPFVVVIHYHYKTEDIGRIADYFMAYGTKMKPDEDVLMFLPGKTDHEFWVISAYRTEESYQQKGVPNAGFEGAGNLDMANWHKDFLRLETGFFI